MRKRRPIELFSISFLDLLSGALGAVIILYVAIPKNKVPIPAVVPEDFVAKVLQNDLQKVQDENAKLRMKLAEANEKVMALEVVEAKKEDSESSGTPFDAGFKFKGKKIVFLIDTSFSMVEEDRMGQVKAGVKMLLTSMSPEYKIEIVQYPLSGRAPFKSLWGEVKMNTSINKSDAFSFIYNVRPEGGTPTRDVLNFALSNYEGISDIVLLTDGVPTLHNSNTKDDIFDILAHIRNINTQKVQINCIGVGSDFTRDKSSDQYKFLSLLASENNGFFVGF